MPPKKCRKSYIAIILLSPNPLRMSVVTPTGTNKCACASHIAIARRVSSSSSYLSSSTSKSSQSHQCTVISGLGSGSLASGAASTTYTYNTNSRVFGCTLSTFHLGALFAYLCNSHLIGEKSCELLDVFSGFIHFVRSLVLDSIRNTITSNRQQRHPLHYRKIIE